MRNTVFLSLPCIRICASSDFTLGNVEIALKLGEAWSTAQCLPVQCVEIPLFTISPQTFIKHMLYQRNYTCCGQYYKDRNWPLSFKKLAI